MIEVVTSTSHINTYTNKGIFRVQEVVIEDLRLLAASLGEVIQSYM